MLFIETEAAEQGFIWTCFSGQSNRGERKGYENGVMTAVAIPHFSVSCHVGIPRGVSLFTIRNL